MAAPVARRTKPQGDQFLISTQSGWLGGLNTDMAPSSIDGTECPVLENMVAFRQGLRSIRGSKVEDNLSTPTGYGIDAFIQSWQLSDGSILALYARGDIIIAARKVSRELPWSVYDSFFSGVTYSNVARVQLQEIPYGVLLLITYVEGTSDLYSWVVNSCMINPLLATLILRTPLDTPDGATRIATSSRPSRINSYDIRTAYRFRLSSTSWVVPYPALFNPSVHIDLQSHPEYWTRESSAQIAYVEAWDASRINGSRYGDNAWFDDTTIEENTLFAIYRTKNIGDVYVDGSWVPEGNDPEQYFLCGFVKRVASTIAYYPIYPGSSVFMPDEQLSIGNMPYGLSSMLDGSATAAFSASAGYMFLGKKYCSTQMLRRLGLSLDGVQELSTIGEPTDILIGADSALILNPTRTERVTLYTEVNAGNSNYGEYYPLLPTPVIVDTTVGVRNKKSIAQYGNAAFFAQCSDGSIRVWDGTAWSLDLTRGRMERVVRRAEQDGWGISSSNGVYYIQSSTFGILRLSIQEKAGNGWANVSSGLAPANSVPMLYRDIDGERLLLWPTVPGAPVEIEHDYYNGFYNSLTTCKFSTREIEGSKPGNLVRHLKTTVKFVPLPGEAMPDFGVIFRLYVDGSLTATHESKYRHATMTAIFNGEAVGNRFRVEVETEVSGFFVTSVQTEFQSMDARTTDEITTEAEYDLELNGYLSTWYNRSLGPENAVPGVTTEYPDTAPLISRPGYDGNPESGVAAAVNPNTHAEGFPDHTPQKSVMFWGKDDIQEISHYYQLSLGLQTVALNTTPSGDGTDFSLAILGEEKALIHLTGDRWGWNHIAIVCTPPAGGDNIGSVALYINAVLRSAISGFPVGTGVFPQEGLSLAGCRYFDIRVMDKPPSPEAIEAYYRDSVSGRFDFHPKV